MKTKIIIVVVAMLALCSCSYKNIPYFQDSDGGGQVSIPVEQKIVIKPEDKLTILVYSKDLKLCNLLNLPFTTRTIGMETPTNNTYSQGVSAYTVDSKGEIDFPVLGKVKIVGLTREEVAEKIKALLIDSNVVKDPVVTIECVNLAVNVFGEVNKPGKIYINKDSYTILDAISAAGDLTIFGLRENVKVLRVEDGISKTYEVNLASTEQLITSPVYYLQQNDAIYVEPNKMRARQSTVNGNNVLSTSFWISIANLLMTFALYFILGKK